MAIAGDATQKADVEPAFAAMEARAPLAAAVFKAGGQPAAGLPRQSSAFFEDMWRVGCFAGHLFGLAAARTMLPRGGSVIFTGASASLRGRTEFVGFASAKMGLRAVAQSIAREFGPQGFHVAHVVIDGAIE